MLTTRLGWLGAVAYALPILEVWLLTRLSESGATRFLVLLQVLWVLALLVILDRCVRGSRAFRAAADAQPVDGFEGEGGGIATSSGDPGGGPPSPRSAVRSRRLITTDRRRSHR